MKVMGFILISVGLALLLFIGFNFLKEKNKTLSPLPEEKGVKVIFITPSK